MIGALVVAASAVLAAAALVYRKIHAVARDKARFKLAAVRDELVYLAASGQLSVDGPVFKHYFSQVDRMLRLDHPVGLDEVVRALFKTSPTDLDRAIKETRKRIDRVLASQEAQSDEVRGVLAAYYDSLRFSLVANSSIVKFAMLPVHIVGDRAKALQRAYLPQRAADAAKVYDFVDEERKQIAPQFERLAA